jgi:hypothetical protein
MAHRLRQYADDNDCEPHESIKEVLALGFASDPVDAAQRAARTRGFHEVRNLTLTRASQFFRDLADELDGLHVTEPWRAPEPQEDAR